MPGSSCTPPSSACATISPKREGASAASAIRVPLVTVKMPLFAFLSVTMGKPVNRPETLYLSAFQSKTVSRKMVASLGFEPRQADSESAVLPLHHEAVRGGERRRRRRLVNCFLPRTRDSPARHRVRPSFALPPASARALIRALWKTRLTKNHVRRSASSFSRCSLT